MKTESEMRIAECEGILGTRGALIVTSANRKVVKKWLRAQGVPGSTVDGMTLSSLAKAYNDSSDVELNFWRELSRDDGFEAHDKAEDHEAVSEAPVEAPIAAPVASGLGSAIEQLIAGTLGSIKPGLDESSVRTIIDERIAEVGVLRHDVILRTESGLKIGDIKGAHKTFPTLLRAASSRQANGFRPNIMLSGPTGSGKTHAFSELCKMLELECFTNGAVSQDFQLIGFRDASGHYHETPLRKAFGRKAGYMFDEFDSSENASLLCIAAVLANSRYEFPDSMIERHPDSLIVAAGNTWGNGATADFVGRNKIDAAIRSRFPVRIAWDYDEKLEIAISGNPSWAARVQKARALARKAGLKVIIDPRMTQAGAALIASGMSDDEAASLTYLADLSPEQRTMVEA